MNQEEIDKALLSSVLPPSSPKQRGSSYRTSTYYSEKHAVRIRILLDMILSNEKKQGLVIPYNSSGYKNKTLLVWVQHSWAYLLDYMDELGKYTKLYDETKISAEDLGVGIRFRPMQDMANKVVFVDELAKGDDEVVPRSEEQIPWKRELLAYVESAKDGETFEKQLSKGNKFSDGDETWITAVLNTEDFKWKITSDRSILIVLKMERE